MVTTIKNPTTGDVLPQFTMYRYDQLNRLKNMKAFADFNFSNNEWNYSTYTGRYQNEFTYDGNGNIETALAKNANGDVIDNQVYNYHKLGNKKQNNRLYSITDIATITSGKDLPSGQIAFDDEDLLNNNYRYNELGELVYDKQSEIADIKWTVSGKIKEVTREATSIKKNLKFDYDANGNRIAKYVYNPDNSLLKTVYFVRDASGNIMSTYEMNVDATSEVASFALTERPIYGVSRLGIDKSTIEFIGYSPSTTNITNHILGLKQYEGSNHLGNVLTVISDKKIPVDENADGTVDYYMPDIVISNDYAPFGGLLAERSFFSENYPHSFNGKSDDTELGDWQDYGMRMYSTWQRRFVTTDPLMKDFPWNSNYAFAENDVIRSIDLDGLEKLIVISSDNSGREMKIFLPTAGKLGEGTLTVRSMSNGAMLFDFMKSTDVVSSKIKSPIEKFWDNVLDYFNSRKSEHVEKKGEFGGFHFYSGNGQSQETKKGVEKHGDIISVVCIDEIMAAILMATASNPLSPKFTPIGSGFNSANFFNVIGEVFEKVNGLITFAETMSKMTQQDSKKSDVSVKKFEVGIYPEDGSQPAYIERTASSAEDSINKVDKIKRDNPKSNITTRGVKK